MMELHLQLSVEVYETDAGAVPVIRVEGLPGHAEIWCLVDGPRVRTLWPLRDLSPDQLARPLAAGLPSLAGILLQHARPTTARH